MLKSDSNLTGNDRFEGFCIDLLRTISELLGFNYDLYLVPDKKFGAENTSSGEWNGLVKEIIEKVEIVSAWKLGSYKFPVRFLIPLACLIMHAALPLIIIVSHFNYSLY